MEYKFPHKLMVILASVLFVLIFLSDTNLYSQKQNEFDFKASNPEEFIEFLKDHIHPLGFYTINDDVQIDNWIKEEHIPKLMELVDSKESCLHVVSTYSSTLPFKLSTVGNEAIFLIQGFRKNRYPPRPTSMNISLSEKEEILKWWQDRQKQNKQFHENNMEDNP